MKVLNIFAKQGVKKEGNICIENIEKKHISCTDSARQRADTQGERKWEEKWLQREDQGEEAKWDRSIKQDLRKESETGT